MNYRERLSLTIHLSKAIRLLYEDEKKTHSLSTRDDIGRLYDIRKRYPL